MPPKKKTPLPECGSIGRMKTGDARLLACIYQKKVKPTILFNLDGSPKTHVELCDFLSQEVPKTIKTLTKMPFPTKAKDKKKLVDDLLQRFMRQTGLKQEIDELDQVVRQEKKTADETIAKNPKLAQLLAESKSDNEFRAALMKKGKFAKRRLVTIHLIRGDGTLRGRKEIALAMQLFRVRNSAVGAIVGGTIGVAAILTAIAVSLTS